MSQFNFPRINFHGKCIMDPATGNNSWYLPLLIFDAINIRSVIPPRIYLSKDYLVEDKTLDDVKMALPKGAILKEDKSLVLEDALYIEITPIKNAALFKDWASTPLGEHEIDRAYHELYKLVKVPMNRTTLFGMTPGYWNFYGTMSFSYRDVRVTSVATGLSDDGEVLVEKGDVLPMPELADILGAELTMNTVLNDQSTNSAVLVDLLPTMSLLTQIFVDRLSLFKEDKIIFSGRPLKASLRNLNAFRIVNENMPFGGSGVFYSAIPLEQLDAGISATLLKLFTKYGDPNRVLKGLFFRQVVGEIEEERDFDYREKGKVPNPATGNLSGSISPWYEGDMISWPGGRQIIGDAPYIVKKSAVYQAPVSMLTPCPFIVHQRKNLIQLDLLNNFPLVNTKDPASLQQPSPYEKNEYATYDLGEVSFYLEDQNTCSNSMQSEPLGTVHFSEGRLSRKKIYESGGMIYLKPTKSSGFSSNIQQANLVAYAKNNVGQQVRVWKESPVIVISDQSGLYSNQGDDPVKGYRVYSAEKEPCTLRIFNRGLPQKSAIDISIVVYKMVDSGSEKTSELYRIEKYKDGDLISFDTNLPINALYLFRPFRSMQLPAHGYPGAIAQTGFFVNHKVLPRHDFGKYFDPEHLEYEDHVSFETLYKNVFQTFELLTPTMEFRQTRYTNPAMAKEIVRRTSLQNWQSAKYMPVSRDLSDDQILLIRKWAAEYIELDVDEPTNDQHKLFSDHAEHLKDKHFFLK